MAHWTKTNAREETLRKIKEARARQIITDEHKKKIGIASKRWHQENKDTEKYKERGEKISKSKLESGFKHSKETIDKIRLKKLGKHSNIKNEFKKGFTPWNKGLKGVMGKNWNKGLTKETDERILKQAEKLSKIRKERIALGLIKVYRGEEASAWLGGKSFEPYDVKFNKEFKNLVKLRDNFCCLNCGISEQKHIILFNKSLHIHHIDYNKENTCLSNCCSLCISCHNKSNFNRTLWINHFQSLLSERYNYDYNKEIILKCQNV